jgi:hypothetical protein
MNNQFQLKQGSFVYYERLGDLISDLSPIQLLNVTVNVTTPTMVLNAYTAYKI